MKVVIVIVAALMLASTHAADVNCAKLCTGGAASCMTSDEAAGCQKTYNLNAMNQCVQCGTKDMVTQTKDATGALGGPAGDGKWWKSWNSGTCSTCVTNCETCATATTCAAAGCKKGFRLKDTKTCEACTQANCDQCTATAGTCTACAKGYGLKAGACVKCNGNCKKCDAAAPQCDVGQCERNYRRATGAANVGTCYSCVTEKSSTDECTKVETWAAIVGHGLFLNDAAGTCTSCVANCAVCGTQDTCTQCKTGYRKSADSKTCTACGVANCDNCQTTADTTTCEAGGCKATYNLSGDAKFCKSCPAPGVWAAAGTGTCTTCNVANCKQCVTNGATCQTCKDGFVKNAAGTTCLSCIANCKTCTEAQTTDKAAAAQKCTDGNAATNSCMPGYWQDDTVTTPDTTLDRSCVMCSANCKLCENQYKCATCEDGYHKDSSGKCYVCKGDKCDALGIANGATAASQYTNTRWQTNIAPTCSDCFTGCSSAAGQRTANAVDGKCECQTCGGGYWPWSNAAPPVALGAQATKPTGSCKICTANCATCASSTTCDTCKTGYTKNAADGTCHKCGLADCNACVFATKDTQCTTCKNKRKNDGTLCYSCPAPVNGVAVPVHDDDVAGTCTACPANCAGCTSATACNACKAGYVLDAANNACVACGLADCNECVFATRATLCTTCKNSRKNDGTKCYTCAANQAVWDDATAGTCTSCNVANCATCASQTTCNTCAKGYIINAGTCHKCAVTNCATCAFATKDTTCTTCDGKYALEAIANPVAGAQTNKCEALCDAHATSCTDAYTAASCDTKKSYYLAQGRCVYCNLKMKPVAGVAQVAAAGVATTDGNQYLSANGICATCDPDAEGCAGLQQAADCKTATNNLAGGNCVAECTTWQMLSGYDGKCHSGCVNNVAATGKVNGGVLHNELGGCYGFTGREAQLCSKGHHVQGAGIGKCCNDDNTASGLVVGSVTLASVVTALYALM